MKRYTPAIRLTKVATVEDRLTTHAETSMTETDGGGWIAVEDIPTIIKWILAIWD